MSPQSCFRVQKLLVKGPCVFHLSALWLIDSGPHHSSDIWAIGCILYFLMVGQSPFLALNDYLSFKKIEALDYTFLEGFDPDARDLVQRLLVGSLSQSKRSVMDCFHRFWTRRTV
jgi:serine/threonine protein kinase